MSANLPTLLTTGKPQPGEGALDACRRIFRGQLYSCNRCDTEISWMGVCDECTNALRLEAAPPPIEDVLVSRGVPPTLRHASWRTFNTAGFSRHLIETLEAVRQWRPGDGPPIMVLAGPPGVGKSHIAVATLRRYLRSGRCGCRFVAVPELLERLRAGYSAEAKESELAKLERYELLVLDDLGAARATDWSVDVQSSIISARHNQGRGLIVTTNLSLNQVADRIDERVASRLAESLAVRLDLADYRARKKP